MESSAPQAAIRTPGRADMTAHCVAFLTGALSSYYFYVILRYLGSNPMVNQFLTLVMCYLLLGVCLGALFATQPPPRVIALIEGAMAVFCVVFLFCASYTKNLSNTVLIWEFGFKLWQPKNAGILLAVFFAGVSLIPAPAALASFYFNRIYSASGQPHLCYVIHIAGFAAGGPVAYAAVTMSDLYTACFLGYCAFFFLQWARLRLAVPFLLLSLLAWQTNRLSPENFFTWQIKGGNYEKIESCWSPYQKLDFLSFNDDHCVATVFDNMFIFYNCDDPELDYHQRKEILRRLARNYKRFLVIGGSLGTSASVVRHMAPDLEEYVSVEVDPVLVEKSIGEFAKYNGHLFKDKRFVPVVSEGRAFLERYDGKHDFIFLDGVLNKLYNSPMGYVSIENYLFTQEGLRLIIEKHLDPNGLLLIDIGGLVGEDVYQFMAGLPEGVHSRLFWWVVPDYPLLGMTIFMLFASRDKNVMDSTVEQLSRIHTLLPVEVPTANLYRPPTDDRPLFWEDVKFGNMFLLMACLFLSIACYAGMLLVRHSGGSSLLLPVLSYLLGVSYLFVEYALVLRGTRTFRDHAIGMVINLSLFLAGSGFANIFAHRFFGRVKGIAGPLVVAGLAISAVSLFVMRQNMSETAASCLVTFLGGLGAGAFWPVLMRQTSPSGRSIAYGVDSFGMMTGGLMFQWGLAHFGFDNMAKAGFFGFLLLAVLFLLFRKKTLW